LKKASSISLVLCLCKFKEKYWEELEKKQDVVSKLAKECREKKVTLLYSSKESRYNNAVALKEYLEKRQKM